MDIQGSSSAARVRWQPMAGVAGLSAVAGSAIASAEAGDSADITLEAGGATGPAAGLTGTGEGLLDTPPLMEPVTRESVAADARQLGDELRLTLAMAGIKSDPPIAFTIDETGGVKVDGDDPRAAAVNDVLSREPGLQDRLRTLVGNAQWVEIGEANAAYHRIVNGGGDPNAANKQLVAAAQQISNAKGFSLDETGKLSLECDGMGEKLMPEAAAQVSDEERMWREVMRLTDRTRRSGVVAAAEDAAAAEKQDLDRRLATGDGTSGTAAGQTQVTGSAAKAAA